MHQGDQQPASPLWAAQYPVTDVPARHALHSTEDLSVHESAHLPNISFSTAAAADLYAGVPMSLSLAVLSAEVSAARLSLRVSMFSVMKSHPGLILSKYASSAFFSLVVLAKSISVSSSDFSVEASSSVRSAMVSKQAASCVLRSFMVSSNVFCASSSSVWACFSSFLVSSRMKPSIDTASPP